MKFISELRTILYNMKQEYGRSISVYIRDPDSLNTATGRQTITETPYNIRKATVLPVNLFLKFFRFNGIPSFSYGNDLNIQRQIFIIDRRDIRGIDFDKYDENRIFILYNHKRYSVESIEEFEPKIAYYFVGKATPNTPTTEQISISLQDWVFLNDSSVAGPLSKWYQESVQDTLSLTDGASHS